MPKVTPKPKKNKPKQVWPVWDLVNNLKKTHDKKVKKVKIITKKLKVVVDRKPQMHRDCCGVTCVCACLCRSCRDVRKDHGKHPCGEGHAKEFGFMSCMDCFCQCPCEDCRERNINGTNKCH